MLAEAGKAKLAAGKLTDAVDLLQRAVAADGKEWRMRSALGLAYDRLGDYDSADGSYKAALALAPDNASILNNYGMSRAMANDLGGARTLLQRAVAAAQRRCPRAARIWRSSMRFRGDMTKAEEMTRRDLPPALVGATLDYYRQLAAAARPPMSRSSARRPHAAVRERRASPG